jgi:hypothetical protein
VRLEANPKISIDLSKNIYKFIKKVTKEFFNKLQVAFFEEALIIYIIACHTVRNNFRSGIGKGT